MALKYKVGDRVLIKDDDWYYYYRDRINEVSCGSTNFIPDMTKYCDEIVTISAVLPTLEVYHIKEDGCMFNWTDEMIECKIGESDDFEKMYVESEKRYEEYSKGEYCHEQSFKWGFQEGCDYTHENEKLEINLKNGYQFVDENGNIINATKIVLEKKKPEYPNTYEECCAVLRLNTFNQTVVGYKYEILSAFQKLLICRDAYWKIAGEEMGLGKPWEPDWKNDEQFKYIIICRRGCIIKDTYTAMDTILAFPTAEMRDAFKENFKSEIESCKELL